MPGRRPDPVADGITEPRSRIIDAHALPRPGGVCDSPQCWAPNGLTWKVTQRSITLRIIPMRARRPGRG